MNFRIFTELIELKAKTASVFPFLLGLGYSIYHYHTTNLLPLIIYFVAMFLFNCFVDIWDNYNDYHKAVNVEDYQKNTNIIGREHLSLKVVRGYLAFFFISSLLLGLLVASLTGWAVFFLGLICYIVGVFYSGGPRPLSALPVGELLSGVTMGYIIFLISVYINSYEQFSWDWSTIGRTLLIALPNILLISNLMLANNTCDLEEDESNQRYTIVHYIGKKAAVVWWKLALIIAYVAIVACVVFKILPLIMLGIVLTIPLMIKLAKPYISKQVKRETFSCSVKILMVFQLIQVILLFIGIAF